MGVADRTHQDPRIPRRAAAKLLDGLVEDEHLESAPKHLSSGPHCRRRCVPKPA